MRYVEDDLLMLSGIQHFFFCERQWALIHIEKQWQENVRTIEGKHIHERADDPFIVETRGDIVISRSVPLSSYKLGLYGIADVIEFVKTNSKGISLKAKDGQWTPIPVEYKRGKPKTDKRDEVQLCAQAICLEEMLNVTIDKGYLFYNTIKRRSEVVLDNELRTLVQNLADRMHLAFEEGKTPKAKFGKHCDLCSMKEICQPKLTSKKKKVKEYIKKVVAEE
ncbi:MAG: CRISPR-associated protein Cas4 [Halanaerobiales bacterium]|nr:CRISPR-associated protein Cas4 [Halanaerobiales bacterium]